MKTLKEIAKNVRQELKKEFPNYRFSVRTSYASMCQNLAVSVTRLPENPFVDEREKLPYLQLNKFHLDKYAKELTIDVRDGWVKNKVQMTEDAVKMLKRVNEIANQDNWDNSDAMTDYFDVNYYFTFELGKWNKAAIVK